MESPEPASGLTREVAEAESQKWAQYYSSLNDDEAPESAQFGEEFRRYVEKLLPDGGRILEAGCGAGWQSLALARAGQFDVHLMDFSEPALDAARRVFLAAGQRATFVAGDATQPGKPEFDLVFNVGVIEHYTLEEQVQLLRAMASRSRKYVVCVAPNSGCYWYWISRIRNTAVGNWPFGTESPTIDFRDIFAAAGIRLLDQTYMARAWVEGFIRNLPGIPDEIRGIILDSHRSQLISAEQTGYLLTATGTVGAESAPVTREMAERHSATVLRGALAEAVALRRFADEQRKVAENEAEAERSELQKFHAGAERYAEAFDHALTTHRGQRAWKVMVEINRAYVMAVREGWRGALRLLKGPRRPLSEFEPSFPQLRRYIPAASAIGQVANATRHVQLTGQSAPHRYDVVILAIIDFDFRFQRPQQIAAELARQGHRVFWISPTRAVPPDSSAPYHAAPLRENIWEVHVRGNVFDVYFGVPSDEAVSGFCTNLRQLYRDFAVAETVIIAQLPFWRRFALDLRREPSSAVVYDCMDDWDTFENLGDFNRTEEPLLTKECDLLVVTAAKLKEKFAVRGIESELIRNGADFEFFQNSQPLEEFANLPKPVVGYFGAIADWIDLDLVFAVAKSRPQYSFVLVGQVFGRDTTALERLPNVRLAGARPYEQMPRLLASFDVCQIPFLLNQVTHATDPVKLYEYLTQGKPVVATDMSELRQSGELIYLANGAAEFAEKLDAAVSEASPEKRAHRMRFARENSWKSRVHDLDEAIRGKFPKVSILIVTYNSEEYIAPCLKSVARNTSYPNYEVIVVDNASTDRSASKAEEFASADDRVKVIRLAKNQGFAGGNNAASEAATGSYLVLLNADTIVTPGWIAFLMRHLLDDSGIGLVCPVTNFAGNEAKINVDYQMERDMEDFSIRLARQKLGSIIDVECVPLYCALMGRDLFQKLGGLDAGYEIGMFEDDDLSNAVRAAGLRTCVADDCFVHHFGQGSFSRLSREAYDRIFSANRRRFEEKWKRSWTPHKTRALVRPIDEERRFDPKTFRGTSR